MGQQYIRKVPLKKTGSQDLSSAKLEITTSFGKKWQLCGVYIHFDAACSEDVSIKRDSENGSDYDTVIKSETLSAATDFAFRPSNEEIFEAGDELNVQVSTGGTANAYLEIVGREI